MAGHIEVREESHVDEFLSKYDKAIQNGLKKIGMQAERNAKANITSQGAVDTGRLRNSITYAVGGGQTHVASSEGNHGEANASGNSYDSGTIGSSGEKAVYIGSGVEYAPYVEFGTGSSAEAGAGGNPTRGGMRPRPYLRPAATQHADQYEKLMKTELNKIK